MAVHLTSPDPLAAELTPLVAAVARLEQQLAACRASLPKLEGGVAAGAPAPATRTRRAGRRTGSAIGLRLGAALLLLLI